MRILIATWIYPKVSESFVHEPAGWLQDAGHEIRVVTERRATLMPGDRVAVPAVAFHSRLPRTTRLGLIARRPVRAIRRLPAAFRAPGPLSAGEALARSVHDAVTDSDCVLCHFGNLGLRWLQVAALSRKPMAVYFHGYDASKVLDRDPAIYTGLFSSGVPLLVNSEYLRNRLVERGAPSDRTFLVRLAASPDFANDVGNGDRENLICTVGRLVEKKGIDDALHAFALAQDVLGGRWRYRIIGEGELRDHLTRRAGELGVAHLVDFRGAASRAEVRDTLLRSRLFVLLSRTAGDGDTEGTPIAIMEAGLSGVPVVATNHAGISEMLPGHAPGRGFLVRERDVDAAAAAIRRLAGDDREREEWGRLCRNHIVERHSAHDYVTRLTDVLRTEAVVPTL